MNTLNKYRTKGESFGHRTNKTQYAGFKFAYIDLTRYIPSNTY